MAAADTELQKSISDHVTAALAASNGDAAEDLYTALVRLLETVFGKNQKEIAAELQRIAKELEASGRGDDAMVFKQRTCEIMLKLSMADRMAARQQSLPKMESASLKPAATPSVSKPLFHCLEYLFIGSANFEADRDTYINVLKAQSVWEFSEDGLQLVALRVASGAVVLLANSRKGSCHPIYSVDDLNSVMAVLHSHGFKVQDDVVPTPSGKACLYKDLNGNLYAFLSKS